MSRRISAAAVAFALLMFAAGPALADETIDVPDDVGTVVGIAWDPDSDRLWVAGDEANQGKLIGIDVDGKREEISWKGEVSSVQALAIHDGRLYIGDLGNPDGDRSVFTIFQLANTRPGPTPVTTWKVRYPDNERLDAAAMMVSAKGNIYIATRGEDPGIFRASANPGSGTTTLRRVADAPDGVTDGVFIDDGQAIALRTEKGVEVIDAYSFETTDTETYESDPGDESITARGDELLIGATSIRTAKVPEGQITSNPGTASPAPSATDSAQPSVSPSQEPSPSSSSSVISEPAPELIEPTPESTPEPSTSAPTNRGTMIALGIAGLVALIAGAVTLLSK